MVKRLGFLVIFFIAGCAVDKTSQKFSFPFNAISPAPAAPSGGAPGIEIQTSLDVTMAVLTSNLVFDGVRLLLPNTSSAGFPINNTVSFDYLSTSLSFQANSTTNYGSGTIYYGYNSPAPTAGQSALFWSTSQNGNPGTLTIRDDSSGAVLSNTSITFSNNYGCGVIGPGGSNAPITFCNGNYYGVCTTNTGYIRFFSFDSSGTMQSAVTTTLDALTYHKLNALTCYNRNSLILVTDSNAYNAYNGFYKYDLSFNLIATDSNNSYSFPSNLQRIVGIATDGTYLYLQGSTNNGKYTLGKATFGNLK